MKAVTNPQEWIDRYVYAVGRLMPAAQRADVEQEMRSLIGDELDAVTPPDSQPNEDMVFSVLRKFGRPEEIAARYHPPAYLIGPTLFPIFRTVLGVVLGVVAGVTLFAMALGIATGTAPLNVGDLLGGLFNGLIQVFGSVVIVFAIIEYFTRREATAGGAERDARVVAWDVRSLAPVQHEDRPKVGELVASIIGALIGIFVFNALPNGFPGLVNVDGEWQTIQLFAPEFWRYVPWLTALWLLEIALSAWVLARGHWSTVTRWLEVGHSVLGIALMLFILVGGPIAANPALEIPFKLVVAIVFAVEGVQLGQQIYRMVMRAQRTDPPGIPSAHLM